MKTKTAQKLATALGVSLNSQENDQQTKYLPCENNGFVRVAALTNEVRVGDVNFNVKSTIELIKVAYKKGVSIAVFPELNVSSYSVGDLMMHDALVKASAVGVQEIAKQTLGKNMLVFVGFPFRYASRLYNCAAALFNGEVIAIIPKKNLPNYNEFYERRLFCEPDDAIYEVDFFGKKVPFGYNIILQNTLMPEMKVACEICEDLWVPNAPSITHALNGATVIANLSASNEVVGKKNYRRQMVQTHSSKCLCTYVYSSAGSGESTSRVVFGGHNMVVEAGKLIAESLPFENGIAISDTDLGFIEFERNKKFKYKREENYRILEFALSNNGFELERRFPRFPFVPEDKALRDECCEEVLTIQAHGLAKRINHIGSKKLVLGLSGGLDSTCALLVCEKALKLAGLKPSDLIAITMPCFGTSNRTYNNSYALAKEIKCTFLDISIKDSVLQHFKDIKHDPETANVVYENCQARERTQVLMDYANKVNGIVVGTGDLSEIALGWSTYNGDHMSMYSVNSCVPKTLMQAIVSYEAEKRGGKLGEILNDVVSTPISPELKPSKNGEMTQPTEHSVGPYILNDFYLYYLIKQGFSPSKVFYLALHSFKGEYDAQTIYNWLALFIRRFFTQQFKRSCQPDGIKIGALSLSPTEWMMPSDSCYTLWLNELESVKEKYNLQ
ncbi:MAG: NAD(+) synthase [Clostridia bacterium]|nr:NAD(+) synthase [Clostridia bacterium]